MRDDGDRDRGGNPGHDRFLGVLMLDTRFPRQPGDVGVAASWQLPVRYRTVVGATPARVVLAQDPALLAPFVEAGRALVADGARALTTSCGFLVQHQAALQAALPVPVWTSALLKLPELVQHGCCPGVLTVDARALGAASMRAAGAAVDTPVEGLPDGGSLQRTLLEDRPALDVAAAEVELLQAAHRLVERHPAVDTIVLECTNLPPWADAIQRATGRPVHHLMTLVHERWEQLR